MLFLSKKEIPFKDIVPDGYVDIHSHLIPGIDDGVKTMYQSAYILEQFQKLGVKKVITTPHVLQQIWPNSTETILQKYEEVNAILPTLGIEDIQLKVSAEYMLDDLFFQRIKDKDILPLHDKYVLVEMSTFSPPMNLNEMLFETKLAGYIPILAHPERYTFYQKDIKKFDELKEAGVLFQLNLLSLSGFYGDQVKEFAKKMIDRGYIDFTGSDVHNYQQFMVLEKGFQPKIAEQIKNLMKKNFIFS